MGNFDYIVEGIEEVERHCQLFTDIRGIVNEELGIHYGVSKLAYEVIQEIEKRIKTIPKQYFAYIPGVSYRIGKFPFEAFGKTITVEFRYCNFKDKTYYKNFIGNMTVFPNGFKLSTLTLYIDIHAISGQIIETTFSDTVQHELEHFFQENKIRKSFSEDNDFYKAAVFVKNHFGKNDEVARRIGNMMYFSQKCENEAYVNGLYALLVNNYKKSGSPTSSVLEQSPVYQGLLQLRSDKEWLIKHRNDLKVGELLDIIRNKDPKKGLGINITIDGLIKHAEYADKEIVKRIGKAIVKAQRDCNQFNDLEPTWWK